MLHVGTTIVRKMIQRHRKDDGIKAELKQATKAYDKYTDEQLNEFLKGTEKFVKAIENNDMAQAKHYIQKCVCIMNALNQLPKHLVT